MFLDEKSEVFQNSVLKQVLYSVKISFNIQCTSRVNKMKIKVMHGVNMDKVAFFCTKRLSKK
jgi:hypothetical protein